jgi:hypothetical protein
MWDAIFTWVEKNYPIIGLLIVVTIVVWFIAKLYFNWTNRIKKTEGDCNSIGGNLSALTNSISNLTISFNKLVIFLTTKHGKMDATLFISQSPIQLTELAKRVLNKVGGKDYIDKHSNELIKELESHNIKTALDAQDMAPIAISKFSNADSFKPIKDFIFRNTYYKEINNEGDEI